MPTKPLSRLKNTAKGPIHHIEIHPARNSKGRRAFVTKTFRHPPKHTGQVAPGLGTYQPQPPPEETVHEDAQDMLNHVGRRFGVQPADDGDGADSEPDMDE